ncbi:pumilio domain-containing protein 12-like, partial [Sipha flava]
YKPHTEYERNLFKKIKAKPNSTNDVWKEFKIEKQELRNWPNLHKFKFNETVLMSKQRWERMCLDGPKENKDILLNKLFKFSKLHLATMIFIHDAARAVQCLLKQRLPVIYPQIISENMKYVPIILLFMYAYACLKNMLKHGDADQRKTIINSVMGKCYAATIHSNTAKMMALIYPFYVTLEQPNNMMQELYGAS